MSKIFPKLSGFQWFVHLASWVPLAWLLNDFLRGNLTVNPIQTLTLRTGKYALILLPVAITTTRGWMKRLGRNWTRIHRLVYLAGVLVVIHYVWLVKSDIRGPLLYGAVVLG